MISCGVIDVKQNKCIMNRRNEESMKNGTIPAVFTALAAGAAAYMAYENKNLEVTHYTAASSKIPKSFDGYRAVCITDLHNNEYGKDNQRIIREIDRFKPSVILISGDMLVSSNPSFGKAYSLLSNLSGRYRILYGFGNHEYRYRTNYKQEYVQYISELKRCGVEILDNRHSYIYSKDERICVYGITLPYKYYEKYEYRQKLKKKTIESYIGSAANEEYNILLAHTPNYFEGYAEWGADLVLSGHVHGGIIGIPFIGGFISPQYELFPKYDKGVFKLYDSTMFLSRGLGTHTIPVRVFNRPELMCITLKREAAQPL